jgi:hypothetical protein
MPMNQLQQADNLIALVKGVNSEGDDLTQLDEINGF